MKIEVKWLDGQWNAFTKEGCAFKSAGVGQIVDAVNDYMECHLPDDKEIHWEAHPTKFVVTFQDKKASKLSKSDLPA
jgi:hypothetical protein